MDPNPFTEVDRDLLKRCLNGAPGSWNDFVDRFLSLIYHVIGYTAHLRSYRLRPEDVEDIAAEVLLKIVANDFRLLRDFRRESSLATYLTVVSRRMCIQELVRKQKLRDALARGDDRVVLGEPDDAPAALKGMESLEEVEKLLRALSGKEREIVRLYYLEGRTYEEISTETEVPVNTIGSVLSRARKKLRAFAKHAANSDSLGIAAMPPSPATSSRSSSGRLVAPDSVADGAKLAQPLKANKTSKPAKPAKPTKPTKESKEEDQTNRP